MKTRNTLPTADKAVTAETRQANGLATTETTDESVIEAITKACQADGKATVWGMTISRRYPDDTPREAYVVRVVAWKKNPPAVDVRPWWRAEATDAGDPAAWKPGKMNAQRYSADQAATMGQVIATAAEHCKPETPEDVADRINALPAQDRITAVVALADPDLRQAVAGLISAK